MTTEIAVEGGNLNPFALAMQAVAPPPQNMAAFDQVVKAASWLPRFTLLNSNSKFCKSPWSLPSCHWFIMKQTKEASVDCGKSPVVVPVAMRLKAVEEKLTKDGNKWINYYDVASPDFQRVIAEANVKGATGFFYGPEFLLWVDNVGPDGGMWAHLMCGSKSSRNNSAEIAEYAKTYTPIRLPARLHDGGKYKWEVFGVEKANQALVAPPTADEVKSKLEAFIKEQQAGMSSDNPEATGPNAEHPQ